ncbi:MAG: hypothetical protein D6730_19020, partial [Bacteroidetes bacterium]
MFELDIKKAFHRHTQRMAQLSENEQGILSGGFSNFPKAKLHASDPSPAINGHAGLKASRFNSFIPYEGKILGFNAFTQRFLVIEPFLLDLLNAATQEDNLKGLASIHPTFFEELNKHGFILQKDVDETQKVKKLREEVDF